MILYKKEKRRILKKFVTMIVIIGLILSTNGMFHNETKAATYLVDEVYLYSKGGIVSFNYQGVTTAVEFVVYEKDGVEYPAYSLNRKLIGVAEYQEIDAIVEKAVENAAVWRTIINGYPFMTPTQLNCNSEHEAFAATKLAVYDALYTYDWSDFEPINEQGERVIQAAKSISEKVKNSKETKIIGKVQIKEITEGWKEDNKKKGYLSKTYQVETNAKSTKYKVNLGGLHINGIKVTDNQNKEKTEFVNGETFKVLIPISEIEEKRGINTSFNITVTADLKTKPILYGETQSDAYQNYALTSGDWEFESSLLQEEYPLNKTKIKIVKQDTETKEALAGAKFNILDKDKNLVYTDVITNKDGIAEISKMIPGKYYIEEIQSPDNYTKYEELIEIDLAFNETYTVNVNNYKKPKQEEKEIEKQEEVSVTGKKEVLLPQTGF